MTRKEFVDQVEYIAVTIFIQTSYIDANDLENPIKYKGDFFDLYLNINSYSQLNIYVVENTYQIEDSFIFSSNKNGTFYSIYSSKPSTYTYTPGTDLGSLGRIELFIKDIKYHHDVKIYNFYDLIAQLGGIYEILYQIIGFVVFYVAKKIYDYSLVNFLVMPPSMSNSPSKSFENKKQQQNR